MAPGSGGKYRLNISTAWFNLFFISIFGKKTIRRVMDENGIQNFNPAFARGGGYGGLQGP